VGRGLKIVYLYVLINIHYVFLLCGVCTCTPVLLYQYYMTYIIIYERLPTKYICSITIGSCTLKEKVIYLYLFYLYMCTQVHLLVHMHR
jgi:hypothetical protein